MVIKRKAKRKKLKLAPLADPNGQDSGASYVLFGVSESGDKIFADSFE